MLREDLAGVCIQAFEGPHPLADPASGSVAQHLQQDLGGGSDITAGDSVHLLLHELNLLTDARGPIAVAFLVVNSAVPGFANLNSPFYV